MSRLAALPLLLALALACAHAGTAPHALPEVLWPAPPAAPLVQLAALFPDPSRPAEERPGWRRVLDAIAGIERTEADAAWVVRPFGVAATAAGELVIADPDGPGVVRVDAAGRAERVACRGREWNAPIAVAVSGEALLVADAGAGEIVRIARDGRCERLGAGAFERPTGVAVAGDRIWVVDPPRHAVVALSASGAVVARVGALGEGPGQLHFPTAIAAAPDGTLLVVDALNFRVVRLDGEGRFLGAFGKAGDEGGDFARPKGVAADASGRIFVSDAQRDLVLVFAADGAFQCALGASGSTPGALLLPAGLAVAGGRLLVADSHNRRVQVFELLGGRP
jgi:DNA-binding beta-propeller fold protein YncE